MRYDLLEDSENSEDVTLAEKEIDALIKEFDEKYKAIQKKHPDVGIGETATDEAVVAILYRVIHFDEKIESF